MKIQPQIKTDLSSPGQRRLSVVYHGAGLILISVSLFLILFFDPAPAFRASSLRHNQRQYGTGYSHRQSGLRKIGGSRCRFQRRGHRFPRRRGFILRRHPPGRGKSIGTFTVDHKGRRQSGGRPRTGRVCPLHWQSRRGLSRAGPSGFVFIQSFRQIHHACAVGGRRPSDVSGRSAEKAYPVLASSYFHSS